jgi:hypothetical protein
MDSNRDADGATVGSIAPRYGVHVTQARRILAAGV